MPEQLSRLRAWCEENAPSVAHRFDAEVGKCLDHHKSRGTLIADLEATVRYWLRESQERQPIVDPRVGRPAERDDRLARLKAQWREAEQRMASEDPEERRAVIREEIGRLRKELLR